MSEAKRSEILFLYDLNWANPNGDPLDENKPRIDIETGNNFVTDVRLKRTIRDELQSKGYNILVKDTYQPDGSLSDGKSRAMDFMPEVALKDSDKFTREYEKELNKNVLSSCIDVRLFGCTLPFEIKPKNGKAVKGSVTYTGPVQFKTGYSLHPVKCEMIKGTGAFASSESKDQKTFRQEYVLPYSLIMFYGIVNNRAAQHTGLDEGEINLMLNAMWEGTKNLISRTKAGQIPRLLMRVVYKEDFHIGELDKYVSFEYEGNGEAIRDINNGKICIQKLAEKLISCSKDIGSVMLRIDDRIKADVKEFADLLKNNGISVNFL